MHFHVHVNKSIANVVVPGYELEHSMIVDNVATKDARNLILLPPPLLDVFLLIEETII